MLHRAKRRFLNSKPLFLLMFSFFDEFDIKMVKGRWLRCVTFISVRLSTRSTADFWCTIGIFGISRELRPRAKDFPGDS